jgi:hypothetical protein
MVHLKGSAWRLTIEGAEAKPAIGVGFWLKFLASSANSGTTSFGLLFCVFSFSLWPGHFSHLQGRFPLPTLP